jgi:transposase InsO family protein
VVNSIKSIFARYGVPEVVISDNGPQYSSREFRVFSDKWGIHHYTSSPHHPRGNGVAEAAVKVAKSILKKSEDPYIALMEHRNTPDVSGYSASQKLTTQNNDTNENLATGVESCANPGHYSVSH